MTLSLVSCLVAVFAAPPASPSLPELMRAARGYEANLRAGDADLAAQRAALDVADGGLWPRFEARLGYTQNQRDARVQLPDGDGTREIVITPHEQFEASFTLTVPLLDLGRRARIDASERRLEGQEAAYADRVSRTDEAVASAYYEGVFARARATIAETELATAGERLTRIRTRLAAGFAGPLDVARAEAEIERSRRALADARMDEDSARRRLTQLTGQVVDFAAALMIDVDDPRDGRLDDWLNKADTLPAVVSVEREAGALRLEAHAAGLDLVPTIDAFIAERITNANGFGEPDNLQAGVTATFRIDLPTLARDDEIAARARAADRRVEVARRAARARIEDVWGQLTNRKARIAAARSEVAAQERALADVDVRNREGTSTALDLDSARRDLLAARIELARSEAELALARVLLATAAGIDLTAPGGTP